MWAALAETNNTILVWTLRGKTVIRCGRRYSWRRTAEGIHANALGFDTRGLGHGEHSISADAGRARQVSRQHHHDLPELPHAEGRARRADLRARSFERPLLG